MVAPAKSNEIRLTRIYNAPVKMVWDAWTDPEQAAQWWGPRGFTITTHSKDLKPGGHWKYTMHGPDGTDYPNNTIYYEVEPLKKMVYDHGGSDDRPPLFRVTVEFFEIDGKTRLEMCMAFESVEVAEETGKFIKKVGGNATWDRLAEYLAKESASKELFVINRSFDTPQETMFDLWTNPEHLARWMPPAGFEMQFVKADIRPGGKSFYFMTGQGPAGPIKMYGRAEYLKIEKPNRLVYTQQFCDEQENLARHPMSPTWPATMLTMVEFAAEGPDRTRVTVTWEPYGDVTPAELETFIKAKSGMTQGWTGSFDKLEGYVSAGS